MVSKKQNPFPMKDFRGVNPEHIAKLELTGVKKAGQMLVAGQTPEKRKSLAKETEIPAEAVLELVKLSDLARLPGVKGVRARLYYDAGVDSVEKLAAWEPEALLAMTAAQGENRVAWPVTADKEYPMEAEMPFAMALLSVATMRRDMDSPCEASFRPSIGRVVQFYPARPKKVVKLL